MTEVTVPRLPVEVIDPIATITGWVRHRGQMEKRFAELARANPLEALGLLLVGCSVAFLYAERPSNPKVDTFWDSLYFISTCASVGYADITARTHVGKSIAALVMTFGPALCAMVFERPDLPPIGSEAEDRVDSQALLNKMDAILTELKRLNVNLAGV